MAHEFIAKKGLISQGNAQVSGTLVVRDGIEGRLYDTASFAVSASHTLIADVALNVPLTASNADTASFAFNANTASYAINADTASLTENYVNPNAVDDYVPFWKTGSLSNDGPIWKQGDTTVHINQELVDSGSNPQPALTVNQPDPTSYNLMRVYGGMNNYQQVAVRNTSNGPLASTDLILEADTATESSSYLDLGIGSSTANNPDTPLVGPLDGYLYTSDRNLIIGTNNPAGIVKFVFGNLEQDSIKMTIEADGANVSGSLVGSASYADTSSFLNPGAPLYVVSGSNGVPAAFLEPYDYCPTSSIYQPPYKKGRAFYDARYDDWAYYTDTGSGAPSFSFHLGKEVTIGVHNPYPFTMSRMSAVYIGTGSSGGSYRPDVKLAIADGTHQFSDVAGIIRNDIPPFSDGYMLTKGTIHRTNMGTFQVGDRLWLSNTVLGGITNVEPGFPFEQVFVGYCTEAGLNGSFFCDVGALPPPPVVFAGLTTFPTITNNQDGTITISSCSCNLYPDPLRTGLCQTYNIPEATLSMSLGYYAQNYIFVDYNFGHPQYIVTNTNSGNSLDRLAAAYVAARENGPGDYDIDYGINATVGLALANKLQAKDVFLHGIERQSGYTLYETGSLGLGMTAGSSWIGIKNFINPQVDSITGELYHFYHSGSNVYTADVGVPTVTNEYYDDGTGLVPLDPNNYTALFIYRAIQTPDEFYYFHAVGQFPSIDTAVSAQPPGDTPPYVNLFGLLVGRAIVQSGSANIARFDSAFTTNFTPTSVNLHNNLLGLQGGQGGEYYHLTLAEYTGTGTGSFVRSYEPTMSNPQFFGATPGHVPYWSETQTLTLTGSLKVIADTPGTPREHVTINSGSFPDPTNPETLLVRQTHSGSVNNIGAYSNVDNFSQIYNQNFSTTTSASTDLVATNDIGNQESHFIDVGIGSSVYNDPRWPWTKANDGYVEVDGGDLNLATIDHNRIIFITDNGLVAGWVDSGSFYITGSLRGTSSQALWSDWAVNSITASTVHNANTDIDLNGNIHTNTVYAQLIGTASYANNAGNANLISFVPSASLSASWASSSISASNATVANTISFVPVAATSASWVSASAHITNADTASYFITSSVTSASYASSASFVTFVNSFAGLTTDISLTDDGSGSILVSTASVNLFTDPDGFGPVLNFALQSASFAINSGSAQYIVVNYNGGSPIYQVISDPAIVNQTTIIPAAVLSNIRGELRGYGYDNVGNALANRINDRESKVFGLTRQNGLLLFNTGSGFMAVTQGSVWDGATQVFEPDFNSMFWADSNPVVNENYFYHHTASLPPDQFAIEEAAVQWNQWITNYYDSGTDLVPMSASYYVVNYVWRLVGGVSPDEDMSSLVGGQYATLNEARAEAVPLAPSDITELGILVGRAICQSGSAIPVLIESAFASTFQASTVTNHENLDGLEGGQPSQHYHLTAAEYLGTGTGTFVRQSGGNLTASLQGTSSQALSASVATIANSISFVPVASTSASWVSASAFITTAQTASYVTSSNIVGKVTSALNADTASLATAISFVPSAAVSASWVSASAFITTAQTASYVTSSNMVGKVASALNSDTASLTTLALSASTTGTDVSSNFYIPFVSYESGSNILYTDHSAGFLYNPGPDSLMVSNISVTGSLTASIISASGEVIVPPPVNYNDAASKEYVDNLSAFGFDFYFRSGSTGEIDAYQPMYDINTPFSASTQTIVVGSVSASQAFVTFVSPAIGITQIQQGNINVHIHAQRQGGGTGTQIFPSLYMRSASVESLIATTNPITITTSDTEYSFHLLLTSSLNVNLTDRAIVKWSQPAGGQTANITLGVDGQTAAGVTLPIPSSNFVQKSGDIMSGALTSSVGFNGPLLGTASYATTSSYASTAVSASYSISSSNAITASYSLGVPTIKAGILSASAWSGSTASNKSASVVFTTAFPNTNYSVVVTGDAARTWTIQQKSGSRFYINSNSATPMTGSVYWQAMSIGEFYS